MITNTDYSGLGLSPATEARMNREALCHARAKRIVARVLPELPEAHGFFEPAAFVAGSRRHGERTELYWSTFRRLRDKAEAK